MNKNRVIEEVTFKMISDTDALESSEPLKVVVVGDGVVGKTSLLTRFTEGAFHEDYKPTILEQSLVTMPFEGEEYHIELIDTGYV